MKITRLGGRARSWMIHEVLEKELPCSCTEETYFCVKNDGSKKGDFVQVAKNGSPYWGSKAYTLPERLVFARLPDSNNGGEPYLYFESELREFANLLLARLDSLDQT